jgi:hypothetical protein
MKTSVSQLLVLVLALGTLSSQAAESKVFNVRDFGAAGDGVTLDSAAIQKTIDACHAAGGGTVLVPAGTFLVGTLQLKSNIRLYLESSARLLGSTNLNHYVQRPRGEFVYLTSSSWVMLHATNVENVVIEGKGTVDGANAGFTNAVTGQWQRGPLGILFERSKNVSLLDFTVTKTPGWAVTFFECDHVELRRLQILNVMADGINPVCSRHVLYDSVNIDGTGDDPITIKNEGPFNGTALSTDIVISNCIVKNTKHPGVKIGTGTAGVFRNILVKDCSFDISGSVFAIQLMRPGKEAERAIENVVLSNLIVHRARQLFDITTIGVERPVIRNLRFENIQYRSADRGLQTSRFWGTERAPIQNLTLSNITAWDGVKGTWLSLEHVKNAELSGIQLDLTNARTALTATNCENVRCDRWTFGSMAGAGAAVKLENVARFTLQNSAAPPVTNFLFIAGASSRDIALRNVNTEATRVPLVADGSVPATGLSELAQNVSVTDLRAPARVQPNESIPLTAIVQGASRAGPYRLRVMEKDKEVAAKWVWAYESRSQTVAFEAPPLFKPGKHRLSLDRCSITLEVTDAPAAFTYGEFAEIVSPASIGQKTRVTATVRNIGGRSGTHVAELRADGHVVASRKISLAPGEQRDVALECSLDADSRVLTLGDFPPWPFFTAANVDARYFWGHKRLVIEAGGEHGRYDQFGAIYFRHLSGDFDAVAQLHSQSTTTGNNSAIGLVIRNDLEDFKSRGFTTHLRVPIYGGYKIWYLDLDNDGILETRSDGGDTSFPCWYKFEKRGQQFRAYTSADRRTWNPCGKWFTITSAAQSQDVGIFGNAGSGLGETSRVEFSDFNVVSTSGAR